MENYDIINPEYIIREASVACGDAELNHGLSHGWYLSQLRQCLDELAFETHFDKDLVTFIGIETVSLQMLVPKGIWDIQEVYACNVDADGKLVGAPQKVYLKDEFDNSPGGTGYTATRNAGIVGNGQTIDGFAEVDYPVSTSGLLFYKIRHGVIMLSGGIGNYQKLKIIYTGVYGDICDLKFIPRMFFQVTKHWCEKHYHKTKMVEDRATHFPLFQVAENELYGNHGSFHTANKRVQRMTTKERNDDDQLSERGTW